MPSQPPGGIDEGRTRAHNIPHDGTRHRTRRPCWLNPPT